MSKNGIFFDIYSYQPTALICAPGRRQSCPLVVVTFANTSGTVEVKESVLFAAVHETPERGIDRLALGLDVGKLHGFLDEFLVEQDVGSEDTPPDLTMTGLTPSPQGTGR